MQALASHWADNYDWRKVEAKLNSYPNFITNIDGMDIHFIHVKSRRRTRCRCRNAWVARLGHRAAEDHRSPHHPPSTAGAQRTLSDVVIPSIPGYGFSGKPTVPLAGTPCVSRRRGYAHAKPRLHQVRCPGRDWGNSITEIMALQAHPSCWGSPQLPRRRLRRDRCGDRRWQPNRPTSPLRSESMDQLSFFYKMGSATPTRWRSVRKRSTDCGFTDRSGSMDSGSR